MIFSFFEGGKSACRVFNGGCQQKCSLDKYGSVTCGCEDGLVLLPDNKTCAGMRKEKCQNNMMIKHAQVWGEGSVKIT